MPSIQVDTYGSWWTLSVHGAPACGLGLWKPADATGELLAFDVPARSLGLTESDVPDLVSWAQACLDGDVQQVAEVPDVEAKQLTARVRTFTCTGEVVATEGRLYVDFPLGKVPADLPAPNRRWLEATLVAARRLRMVHVETLGESSTLHARVDLTGAPEAWLPGLLGQAVLCLRAATEQLLPALTFLTTAGGNCQALEPGTPATTQKKNHKKTKKEKVKT